LTEGRQALAAQLAGIEGGLECDRLAPLVSALADGEATAEQLAVLRPHMKTCLACRARLREFRATPARVAALMPATMLAAGDGHRMTESTLHAVLDAAHHKAAALADRAHTAAELVTGQKMAALAASAAALAGGGTAVDQLANHHGPPIPPPPAERSDGGAGQTTTTEPSPSPLPLTSEQQATTEEPAASALPSAEPSPPPPDPANEFAPTPSPEPSATTAATTSPQTPPPRATPPARVASSAGEFAP
jgi:hypothetical protein